MQIGGEWFEATEYDVDSPTTVIRLFQAFYETDPTIVSSIEWDEVVE